MVTDRRFVGTYAVSGAASGIGAATRSRLESAGHRVIGVDLTDAEVTTDLATDAGRRSAIDQVNDRCGGRLDGLVTAAGVSVPAPAERIVRVNFFGSRRLLEGLRPALAAATDSRAVQLGSHAATITPGLPDDLVEALLDDDEEIAVGTLGRQPAEWAQGLAYGATKLAIARWIRREAPTPAWIGTGVSLNALMPGPVLTPLLEAGYDDPVYGPLASALPVPAGRPAAADLIAQWIEFLLGPAAGFACGATIYVDGGTDALIRPDDWPTTA